MQALTFSGSLTAVVQYPLALDVAVTAAIFLAFLVVGSIIFVRADRNR
jgi:hypothetical protein